MMTSSTALRRPPTRISRLGRRPDRRATYRLRSALLLTATGLVLAGCGADPTPPPAPSPTATPTTTAAAAEPTVAWIGSVCSAVAPVLTTLGAPPPIDTNSLPETRQAYLSYLDQAISLTDTALQGLVAAGPPPIQGGQQLADQLRTQLSDLRTDLADARSALTAADPSNPGSLLPALTAARNALAALGNAAQAVGTVLADQRVRSAFDQAPACAPLH